MKKIILASASPRRKALLEQTGLKFIVCPSNYREIIDETLPPQKLVEKFALEKAKDVFNKHKNSVIISADTVVSCGGKILGKPRDKAEAKEMLEFLSGKAHSIVTGFTIIFGENIITKSEETKIFMKHLSPQDISDYITTREPMDKAGAYAIQEKGNALIEKIEGDFDSAIGLPVKILLKELENFGIKITQ